MAAGFPFLEQKQGSEGMRAWEAHSPSCSVPCRALLSLCVLFPDCSCISSTHDPNTDTHEQRCSGGGVMKKIQHENRCLLLDLRFWYLLHIIVRDQVGQAPSRPRDMKDFERRNQRGILSFAS